MLRTAMDRPKKGSHGLRASSRVSLHPRYLALGDDPASCAAAYRALLLESLTVDQLSSIRDHMRQERALG